MSTLAHATATPHADLAARIKGDRRLRRQIRQMARADHACPVAVVSDPDHSAPMMSGDSYCYRTLGGQRIYHPSAYSRKGWSNMVYHGSTLRVEVDAGWLTDRLPALDRRVLGPPADLDRIGPRGEDDRLSIRQPVAVYRDDDRPAVLIASQGWTREVEWWAPQTIVQVVVRDSTTGLRHHLTVPPEFARPLEAGETEARRITAAIAWTFGLGEGEYRPDVEA